MRQPEEENLRLKKLYVQKKVTTTNKLDERRRTFRLSIVIKMQVPANRSHKNQSAKVTGFMTTPGFWRR
ncbi:hypothetical protein CG434_00825 [Pantoea ananatis]|jgi:hypothetical protein|nr:hypothetical protein CG434_00825 [Pantoea ananatis]